MAKKLKVNKIGVIKKDGNKSTTAKADFINLVWGEIKDIEANLLKMHGELVEINKKLQGKYKTITATFNEKYSIETFLTATDFTSNTLYYCLNPLLDATGLFFIPSKDGVGLIPIQVALDTTEDSNPILHVGYNPQYALQKLQEQSITIMDVVIPYRDLKDPVINDHVRKLAEIFDNPPQATEPDKYKNYIYERLFALTQQDQYKEAQQPGN